MGKKSEDRETTRRKNLLTGVQNGTYTPLRRFVNAHPLSNGQQYTLSSISMLWWERRSSTFAVVARFAVATM